MPIEFINNEFPLNQKMKKSLTSIVTVIVSSDKSTGLLENIKLKSTTSKITKSTVSPLDVTLLLKYYLRKKKAS